ncbi:hypothetical protein D9M70_358880 [compost metagenome]
MATSPVPAAQPRRARTLSCGSSLACHASICKSPAIAATACGLSPLSSSVRRPRRCSSAITSPACGIGSVRSATSPCAWPSQPTSASVHPSGAVASSAGGTCHPSVPKNAADPSAHSMPPNRPDRPSPALASTSLEAGGGEAAARAMAAIARAIGWSEACASAAATRRTSAWLAPSVCMPTGCSVSAVSVPVLSKAIPLSRASLSSTSPPRTSMPRCAASPIANACVSGAARPSEHGHATTSTASPASIAASAACAGVPARLPQNHALAAASASTPGMNTAMMRSTVSPASDLRASASRTCRPVCCHRVCEPAAVARTSSGRLPLMLPACTSAPGGLNCGSLCPVRTASSHSERPSMTMPSTGTRSPGRIRTRSPGRMSTTARHCSVPPSTTRASARSAASIGARRRTVRTRTCASSRRPSVNSSSTMAAVSK